MNLRQAIRALRKRPYVSIVGVISLAFGIGATTAIFSLYLQLLLRPLPVPEADRLVNLSAPGPSAGSQSCGDTGDCEYVFSYPLFRDLETQQTSLEGIAAHVPFGVNLASNGVTTSGSGELVSGRYFELLRLKPAIGRLLSPADDRTLGDAAAVVLSFDYWTSAFGQDLGVLGRTLTVNGRALTIIGVAPRNFTGTNLLARPNVFVPVMLRAAMQPGTGSGILQDRKNHWLYLFGRLKGGIDRSSAEDAMNVHYHRTITEVEVPAVSEFNATQLAQFKSKRLLLEDGRRGQSVAHKAASTPLTLLFLVAALVLAIVCTNLANLLLVQASDRAGELAVRLSLGGSRIRIVTQLLSEAGMLALLGGIGAMVVSKWTLNVVLAIFPEAIGYINIDASPAVILFAATVTIAAGLAFGLIPALHATRSQSLTLKTHTARASGSRGMSAFRSALASAQIAFSLILLICGGLFTRSLLNLSRVDLGVKVENVVVFDVSPGLNRYNTERLLPFHERMEEELRALPGVTAITAARVAVLADDNWGQDVTVEGFPTEAGVDRHTYYNMVGLNFFSTLGMQLKAGRDFTAADTVDRPKVAIVNEEFARKFNLGSSPIGKRMKTGGNNGPLDMEIVGLIHNAKYSSVKNEVRPVLYLPYRQVLSIGTMNYYVRSIETPAAITSAIRETVKRLDPNLPINNVSTLARKAAETTALDRLLMTLSSAFAVVATLIAAIGLYGVLAYTIAQRTHEFGVRMAVGAQPGQIRMMVLRQVGRIALVGSIIGIGAALGLGRFIQSLLFELRGDDPSTFFTAALFLLLVVFSAGFIPAYRASKVDPMEALRHE